MTYDDVLLTVRENLADDWTDGKDEWDLPHLIADEVTHSLTWPEDVRVFLRTSKGTDARMWGLQDAQETHDYGLRGLYREYPRSVARRYVASCIISEMVRIEQDS